MNFQILVSAVLSLLLILSPIGARLWFVGEGRKAIDKLEITDISVKGIEIRDPGNNVTSLPDGETETDERIGNYLGEDDRGFEEVEKAVREHNKISGEPKEFCLTPVDVAEEQGVDIPTTSRVISNYVFYVRYQQGETDWILYHPFQPETTGRLTELDSWIRETATERSYTISIFFAVVLGWWNLASI